MRNADPSTEEEEKVVGVVNTHDVFVRLVTHRAKGKNGGGV